MKLFTTAILAATWFCAPAFAQDSQQAPEEDVVTATAQSTRNDAAMSAWRAGDFVTAEIEFDKNQMCALRGIRDFRAGVEAAADSTIRADVGTDVDVAPQPSGGQGGVNVQAAPTPTPIPQVGRSNFKSNDPDKIAPRTCDDRPFDLYMRGMSQIKLGKFEDAKDSLTRSVALRKTNCDAYFRLALLEIQDGDKRKARKHLKQLRNAAKKDEKRLERKGNLCDAVETVAQIDFLRAQLR